MFIDNEKTIRFGQFFQTRCRRRDVRAHDTILNAILNEFRARGYEAIFEWQDKDEDSSYRYDVIAQKGKELHVVEIKDKIDIRNFGQIEAYCLQIKRENPNSKVWLGTDCKNYDRLIQGEIGLMTLRLMKEHKLGVILINPELVWFLESHKDLLDLQERGHICEDCNYCESFQMNNVGRKILIAIEDGCKKVPEFTQTDANTWWEYSTEDVKAIKKEMLDIKKKMGTKTFEEKTGLKIEKG